MKHWYVLHTKPHKETQVEATLTERGIQAYLPAVPAPRRRNRNAHTAYFPCYLFASADLDAVGVWALKYLPGVRGLVAFGETPAMVEESFIETLRNRLAQPDVVYAHGNAIKSGDRVVITSGPLADMEAIFDQRLTPAGRVRVLIDMLARKTLVELDASALRKTDPIPRRKSAGSSPR